MATDGKDDSDKPGRYIEIADEEDDSDPDEYNVESIVARRKNPKTGGYEYLIKWENYPDSQNTWEPSEHLKCPDLIAKFNEAEKAKRKRRTVTEKGPKSSQGKKTKGDSAQDILNGEPLLAEDDEDTIEAVIKDKKKDEERDTIERQRPRGFERGLPIEQIVGSCTDDNGAVWFFIKWRGHNELELVEIDDIEQNAPKELCAWYRERLYHSLKKYDSIPDAERHLSRTISPTVSQST